MENEFGPINVDSALLSQCDVDVETLSGGCICCGLKANFSSLLLRLSHENVRIVVEPSGIFNPRDFFDVVNEPHLRERSELGTIITVVDPYAAREMEGSSLEIMREQINCAGTVLVSRTAGMAPETVRESTAWIAALLDGSTKGGIEVKPWKEFTDADFERLSCAAPHPPEGKRRYLDHGAIYYSLIIRSNRAFDAGGLQDAIGEAFEKSNGMIRLKGFVPRLSGGFWQVNSTPRDIDVSEDSGARRTFLVAVGKELSRQTIEEIFTR